MNDLREDRSALFANLAKGETQPKFWDRVAEDVDSTVETLSPWLVAIIRDPNFWRPLSLDSSPKFGVSRIPLSGTRDAALLQRP